MGQKHWKVQLKDHANGETIIEAGGVCYVAADGDAAKVALLTEAGATLANPIALTRGQIEFWTADTVTKVDLYGLGPNGHFFSAKDVKPSGSNELSIDQGNRRQLMMIPFSIADTTATTETDTGFDIPVGAFVEPLPFIDVTTLDTSETIDVGTDSTDSGDANGFMAAVSVAVLGVAKGTLADGAQTLGVLLSVDESGGDLVPEGYVSAGKSVTYTLSAGTDLAAGFICLAYILTNAGA